MPFRSLLTRGKGRLVISVQKRAYNPGEHIEVDLHLSTKKELGPGRLFGALICEERIERRERDRDGDMRTRVDTNEIFRREVDIAVDTTFPAGTEEDFVFTVEIPPDPQGNPGVEIPGWIGGMAKIAQALNNTSRSTTWRIIGRFDIKGIDLKDQQKISVNII